MGFRSQGKVCIYKPLNTYKERFNHMFPIEPPRKTPRWVDEIVKTLPIECGVEYVPSIGRLNISIFGFQILGFKSGQISLDHIHGWINSNLKMVPDAKAAEKIRKSKRIIRERRKIKEEMREYGW